MNENTFFILNLKSSLVDLLIYFTTSTIIISIITKHSWIPGTFTYILFYSPGHNLQSQSELRLEHSPRVRHQTQV